MAQEEFNHGGEVQGHEPEEVDGKEDRGQKADLGQEGRDHEVRGEEVDREEAGEKHLQGVGDKEQRQYEHIKEAAEREGRYPDRAKEVAARTVMKQHKQRKHTKGQ